LSKTQTSFRRTYENKINIIIRARPLDRPLWLLKIKCPTAIVLKIGVANRSKGASGKSWNIFTWHVYLPKSTFEATFVIIFYIILSAETSLLRILTRPSLYLFLFASLSYYVGVNQDFRMDVVCEKPQKRICCCYYCFRTAILDGRWPRTCRETHTTYIILKIIAPR